MADGYLAAMGLALEQEFEKQGSHKFHVICVDAFSGDSVPTHLITTEAMDVYLNHLAHKDEVHTYLKQQDALWEAWRAKRPVQSQPVVERLRALRTPDAPEPT